jgi:hypothetical protein
VRFASSEVASVETSIVTGRKKTREPTLIGITRFDSWITCTVFGSGAQMENSCPAVPFLGLHYRASGTRWNDVVVEQHDFTSSELTDVMFEQHVIVINNSHSSMRPLTILISTLVISLGALAEGFPMSDRRASKASLLEQRFWQFEQRRASTSGSLVQHIHVQSRS